MIAGTDKPGCQKWISYLLAPGGFNSFDGKEGEYYDFLSIWGRENYMCRNRPMIAKRVFPKKLSRI